MKHVMTMLSLAVLLAGCATAAPRPSGFLSDYSGLRAEPGNPALLFWERANVNWKQYTRVLIDPVIVVYAPDAKRRDIQPDELKKLTDYFRNAAVEALRDGYPVVDQPGPGVLRIRTALTDIVPVSVAANVLTSAMILVPLDVGGAALEVEFLDAATGERLAAVVDRKRGGPLDVIGSFAEWGHVQTAFRQWAKELREALDEAHGKKKP